MDKDKKKIIAGTAILGGAGLVYLLTRKRPPVQPVCTPGTTKCIGSDLHLCNAQGQWKVSQYNSPSCAVAPGTAILYGQVTDALTGDLIQGIHVSCDSYGGVTEADGRYRIENITPRDYTITFTDPQGTYKSQTMAVSLVVGLNKLDAALGTTLGRIRGTITDSETNAVIINAKVYLDGIFQRNTDADGFYYTEYISFGDHTITIEANNYQKTDVTITLDQTLMTVDIKLQSLPPAPTDWTEGVIVTEIEAVPSTIYLGQSTIITVSIQYPYPLPLPVDIHGTILVDDTKIEATFPGIDFRNPTLLFPYTPSITGEFSIRSQDKSATLTVLEEVVDTYFSPFGGKRFPLCLDIVIPDVEAFTITHYGHTVLFVHPGGDLSLNAYNEYARQSGSITTPSGIAEILIAKLPTAKLYWNPTDAVVTKWIFSVTGGTTIQPARCAVHVLTLALEYTCKEYWDSKDDLAIMIVGPVLATSIPTEWKTLYGTKIDLDRGIRDWVYLPGIQTNCFQGYCDYWIKCPYCGSNIGVNHVENLSHTEKVALARSFLNHIETAHPNHPLTQPAWF
jgi:hypothetical protein